ncbi:MAG: insulinase family protein [Gemmatimonadaceae bacterium]|nr:insulinase family protein [Gemmatimonadaceae bacterium]
MTMRLSRRRALLALALLGGTGQIDAQPLDLRAPLPRDTALRTDSLPNGIRLVARRVGEPAGRVELRLVIDAGSALERDDERGAAHLIEHLAFEGTAALSRDSLRFLLSRLGQSGGAHANATTSADETVYKLTVPNAPAALAAGLGVLAQWAQPLPPDRGALERQRPIVLEEWRLGRSAQSRLGDAQQRVFLAGTRYEDRAPIGTDTTIRALTLEQLQAFRARWYRPGRMRVLLVGDVEPRAALTAARAAFAVIPASPTVPDARPALSAAPSVGGRAMLLTDTELTARGVSLVWPIMPRVATTVGAYRAGLSTVLMIDALQRRLAERGAQADAPFTAATVEQARLNRRLSVLALTAIVAPAAPNVATATARATEALAIELGRLATLGITSTERDRGAARLLATIDGEARARDRIPSSAWVEVIQAAVTQGEAVLGPTERLALASHVLPTITTATIDSVARELWQIAPMIALRAPAVDRAALADTSVWAGAVARARAQQFVAYVDSSASGALIDPPPTPGRVVRERSYAASGVTEWVLSNGMRVWLKPTTGPAELVRWRALSVGGLSLASDANYPSALLAAAAVDASGLGRFSRVALSNRVGASTLQLGMAIGPLSEAISGVAEPRDVETIATLLHLAMAAPRRDSVAWNTLLERQRATLRDRSADPARALADTIGLVLTRGHARARGLTAADLARASLDSALAFYRSRFGDAGDITLLVVGRFTIAGVRPLIERYLASVPGTPRVDSTWQWRERWRDLGVSPPARPTETVVRRGQEPRSETALVFTGPLTWSRRTATGLSVLSDVLAGRLQRRLREAMGGTYGVNVAAGVARAPREEATITVRFASAPERAEELAREVLFAADSLQRYGATDAEVAQIVAAKQRQLAEARKDDRFWLEGISAAAEFGESPESVPSTGEELGQLAALDMKELAQRALDARRLHRFTLLPNR